MLIVIITLTAVGAVSLAAAFLTTSSLTLRCSLKAPYRKIAFRVLTAIGRNYTGIDRKEWSRTVAIATTQKELRQSCPTVERDAGMRLVATPLGAFWIPDTGREGYDGFLLMVAEEMNNHYQFEAGAYVLDCGANLGTFTRLALCRGAEVVVAIEPAPEIARCLQRTFAKEILRGRVMLVTKGLWDKDERLFLRTSEDSWNNTISTNDDGHPGEWLLATTIDKIVADLNLPAVSFIKMDIEGAEVRALDGAKATIRRWSPLVAVATEHTEEKLKNTAAVVAMVKEAGPYSGVCIKGSIRRIPSLLGVAFPNSVMPEIILLRPDSASVA